MKKLSLILALLFTLSYSARSQTVIGITFHAYSSSPTDIQFMDLVCALNANFAPGNIVFYTKYIDRGGPSPSSAYNAISRQDPSAINVYMYNPSGYINKYMASDGTHNIDAIFLNTPAAVVLTHEMGHYFGLPHTNSSSYSPPLYSSCIKGGLSSGDHDGCFDTDNSNTTGNWMVDETFGTACCSFTSCQWAHVAGCLTQSLTPILGPPYVPARLEHYATSIWITGSTGIRYDFKNVIPLHVVTTQSSSAGSVIFSFPSSNCMNQATTVDLLVTTQCLPGSNEYQYSIIGANPATVIALNLTWGIKSILYTFHYPDGTTNQILVPYNIAGFGGCSIYPPGGEGKQGSTSINIVNTNTEFELINNISSSSLHISNKGYNTMAIYDMYGKIIKTETIGEGKSIIDITDLTSGSYILQVKNSTQSVRKKFSKL